MAVRRSALRALPALLVALLSLTLGTGARGARPHVSHVNAGHGRMLLSAGLPTWTNDYPWLGDSGQGYVGIGNDTTAAAGAYGFAPALGGEPGLWLYPIGDQRYSPGQAEFTYAAPGTTRIASATLDISYRNKVLAHQCLAVGLRTADGVVDGKTYCNPPLPPDSQSEVHVELADPADSPTAKQLFFQLVVPPCVSGPCSWNIPQLDPLATGGYARLESLHMVLVDDDDPIADATGDLASLADTYIDGRQSYGVTISAHDPGSGVVSAGLTANGTEVLGRTAPCDPTHNTAALDDRICPEYFQYDDSFDTGSLPEGATTFSSTATDVANNTGTGGSWRVFVDRTPPGQPSNVTLAAYDASSSTADIAWDGGDDPPLPDGNPGSGTQSYQYRVNLNGTGWSDWTESDEPDARVVSQVGDVAEIQVRGVDGVGNTSDATDASVTVYDAGGDIYPYSSATEDADSVTTLTDAQTQAADAIAESSGAVRDVVGSRDLTPSNYQPWVESDGTVEGVTFTLSWSGAATLTGPWRSIDIAADGSATENVQSYEADDVTSVDVTVDLADGQVVEVNPGMDSTVPDDSDPSAAAPLADRMSHKLVMPGGGTLPIRNLRLITSRLVGGVGNDSWWNWDFNTQSVSPYNAKTGNANVDMPISLVFWGDVDVATAKDIWNRGQSEIRLLASPMHELVHDRPDPGQPADHKEPATAVWDSDRGTYLGRPGTPFCRMHVKWHYRVYAPGAGSGGDNRMYSPAWGYYVIASTHIDYKEECPDGWSGDSEVTEHRVAAEAPNHTQQHYSIIWGCTRSADPWQVEDALTHEQKTDTLDLYNRDEVGFSADHKHMYFNDGMATMIHVPNISHPLWVCTH